MGRKKTAKNALIEFKKKEKCKRNEKYDYEWSNTAPFNERDWEETRTLA
jgi:hypothetical protein